MAGYLSLSLSFSFRNSLVLVKALRDAEAHAEVLAYISLAVVDQTVAALARLKLLDQDCAEFLVNLGL